jgi:hypothetical protein
MSQCKVVRYLLYLQVSFHILCSFSLAFFASSNLLVPINILRPMSASTAILRMSHLKDYHSEAQEEIHRPLQVICDSLLSIKDFSSVATRPQDCLPIHYALELMNRVTIQDLKVSQSVLSKLPYGVCMTVVEVPHKFDIAAFLLPKGFLLPLHDHPNMAVCSKILLGSVQVRAFSRRRDEFPDSEENLVCDQVMSEIKSSADSAWLLSASEGNYHEILPLTDCVMLDILLPPYDDHDRNCTFYSSSQRVDGLFQLNPLPQQTRVRLPVNIPYKGFRPLI